VNDDMQGAGIMKFADGSKCAVDDSIFPSYFVLARKCCAACVVVPPPELPSNPSLTACRYDGQWQANKFHGQGK
jgi:hypothetical protein